MCGVDGCWTLVHSGQETNTFAFNKASFKLKTKLNLDFIFKYIFSNFVGHYSKKIPKKRKKKEKIIICES
jgi:hypothetical protein